MLKITGISLSETNTSKSFCATNWGGTNSPCSKASTKCALSAKAVDEEIMSLLDRSAVTFQAILTKTDKLKKADLESSLERTRAALTRHPAAFPEILLTSSEKGDGIETLRSIIASLD